MTWPVCGKCGNSWDAGLVMATNCPKCGAAIPDASLVVCYAPACEETGYCHPSCEKIESRGDKERNQCDGCQRGLPTRRSNLGSIMHDGEDGMPVMICTADRYSRVTNDQSGERPCTCHPDDNPPQPCMKKFALSECREAAKNSAAVELRKLTRGDDWNNACEWGGDISGMRNRLTWLLDLAERHATELDELRLLSSRSSAPVGDVRWLIERTYAKGKLAERREFWLGVTTGDMHADSFDGGNGSVWTTNALAAARFSSRDIAYTLRLRHFHPEAPVEACDHMFNCGTMPEEDLRSASSNRKPGYMGDINGPGTDPDVP